MFLLQHTVGFSINLVSEKADYIHKELNCIILIPYTSIRGEVVWFDFIVRTFFSLFFTRRD